MPWQHTNNSKYGKILGIHLGILLIQHEIFQWYEEVSAKRESTQTLYLHSFLILIGGLNDKNMGRAMVLLQKISSIF